MQVYLGDWSLDVLWVASVARVGTQFSSSYSEGLSVSYQFLPHHWPKASFSLNLGLYSLFRMGYQALGLEGLHTLGPSSLSATKEN